MKEQYPSTYEDAMLTLENDEALRERLRVIQFEGAAFSTDPVGSDLCRAWFEPVETKEFTEDEVARLRRVLSSSFGDITWRREFREETGTYHWRGVIKNVLLFEENMIVSAADIWFIIENTPAPKNCTVKQVEATKKFWISDCGEEATA